MTQENTQSKGRYFVVLDFMVCDLKLKGAERDIFAIIYGFCQDKQSYFYCSSLEYLTEITGYSRQTVAGALQALREKALILKADVFENQIMACKYTINWEVVQNLRGGVTYETGTIF